MNYTENISTMNWSSRIYVALQNSFLMQFQVNVIRRTESVWSHCWGSDTALQSHLQECFGRTCPHMHQCFHSESSCIPFKYLWGGGWLSLRNRRGHPMSFCTGLLRCPEDNSCIHLLDVGKGIMACKLSQDERTCLEECHCKDDCSGRNHINLSEIYPVISNLNVSKNLFHLNSLWIWYLS